MKEIKRKKLVVALVQAMGAGVALSIVTTGAVAQQAQKVDKIEVTGSNIKRVDTETVAPVEIITREQIERTGQPTIADVLKNVPANTGGSYSESFANSFAPGASGISLRGFGQKATLVLLNGRRTAGYGFAQNLQDTFVDLNSIPSAAVERIEILKDGASAIYGSDAIAGVVNIILRKDYKGVEVGGGMGWFEGKNDYRFNLTGGVGDLAKDRYNFFGTFDYYKREGLLLSETEFGHSRDYRGYDGGRNFQSLTAGGIWQQLTATNGGTNNRRAATECAGTIVNNAGAVASGLLASTSGQNIPTNTFCLTDINSALSALPETERYGFLGRFTGEISPTATAYVELALSRVDSSQVFTPPFFAGTTGLQQTAAGLLPFTYQIRFAPGVAGNPFPTNALWSGNLYSLGTRDNEIQSDTLRFLTGAKYALSTWDLDSAIGYSKNEVDNSNINRITLSGTSAVFGVPSTPQPPVPTSTSATFNLDRPSTNSQAVKDRMLITFPRKSESELKFIDTRGSTEFGKLPGGPVGLALGIEYREEKLKDRPAEAAASGDILGQGITATDGSRDSTAIYGELALPITRMLDAQLALRYDKYSDYGSSTTPKVGLKFRPTSTLLMRANWGKGFRAPTLPEISPSVATFFVQVNDPVTNQNGVQISGVFAGNPNLEAEKSESTTAGIVWEPTKNFNVGVSYYDIKWEKLVTSESFQDIVNEGGPRVIRDPSTGNIVTVLNNYINIGEVRTKGVDLDAQYAASTSVGKFTTRVNWTYVDSWKQDGTEYAGTNGGTNTIPRSRGTLTQDWDYMGWGLTGRFNYIHGYHQQLLAGSFFAPQDPLIQKSTYPDRVEHYRTLDLFARYQFNKNLTVNASLINAENAKPPYDPGFSSTYMYDFSLYSSLGRQVRIGFTYKL